MSKLRFSITMSLDGFVVGPDQSVENPLGLGGIRLHEWAFALGVWQEQRGLEGARPMPAPTSSRRTSRNLEQRSWGEICSAGPGPWGDPPWPGWWAPTLRFTCPSLCSPIIPVNLFRCRGNRVHVCHRRHRVDSRSSPAGSWSEGRGARKRAHVAQQYLAAGLIDELEIHIVSLLLGRGARLFDNLEPRTLGSNRSMPSGPRV
jgi:hypothetical protein